jgi:hypothetical protein
MAIEHQRLMIRAPDLGIAFSIGDGRACAAPAAAGKCASA